MSARGERDDRDEENTRHAALDERPTASTRSSASLDRPAARDRRDGRDAALEEARAADLRLRPALVGRLRDRGGARRPRRRLGCRRRTSSCRSRSRSPRCSRSSSSPTRQTVQAYETSGGRVRRREGEPRHAAEPRRRRRAARRLRPDRRRLGRRRRARDHVGGAVARRPQGRRSRSLLVVLLTVVNLRGVRESGIAFALPTYSFVAVMYVMIGAGVGEVRRRRLPAGGRPGSRSRPAAGSVGVFVAPARVRRRARRRSPASRRSRTASAPSGRRKGENAGDDAARHGRDRDHALPRRLLARGADARPPERDASRSSRRSPERRSPPARPARSSTTPSRALTFAILVLAANTSYQGFPRLAAVLAATGSSPASSSTSATGSSTRTGSSSSPGSRRCLIWVFNANVIALIHLYVVGVFTAFTLSQAGMVRYWRRTRDPGWRQTSDHQRHRARRRPASSRCSSSRRSSSQGAWTVTVAIPLPDRRLLPGQPPLPQGRAAAARRHRRGRGRTAGDERGRALRRVARRCPARGASGTRGRSPATTSAPSTSRVAHRYRASARVSAS